MTSCTENNSGLREIRQRMHFHLLSELTAHRGTIVVPDAASARLLRAAFDHRARARGEKTWHSADILAWPGYLARAFEQLSMNGDSNAKVNVEFVLSTDQELAIWENVIAADAALSLAAPDQAAVLAREASRIVHLWALPQDRLFEGPLSDDVAAFGRWSDAFRERTAALRVVEQARLATQLDPNAVRSEHPLLAHGFLETAPAVAQVLESAGIAARRRPDRTDGDRSFDCRAFPDREAEIYAAVQWAADLAAADPQARVVIACEGLAADHILVRRCLTDVLGSAATSPPDLPFYLSVETPLGRCPLVRDALSILEFSSVCAWDAVSGLIRSPHIRAAAAERCARAAFDCELRSLGRYQLPAAFVASYLADVGADCPEFANLWAELTRITEHAPRRQRMVQWLEHFDRCLKTAGWPGDREPDQSMVSIQRQWGDACDRLHRLDAISPPVSRGEALNRLRRLLMDTAVRETPWAPRIFVVTAAQACMLEASHLWIAGCRSDAFVTTARPSGLLPFELQRRAGVPGAESNRDLFRARAVVESLACSSDVRVASYSASEGDIRYTASPLIYGLSAVAIQASRPYVPAAWRRARETAVMSCFVDDRGPPLPRGARVDGGVAILAAEAACPFQAFARHRLLATAIEEPRPGIDAREKGTLVHRTLAALWTQIRDGYTLAGLEPDERRRFVLAAISKIFTPLPFETPLEREVFFVERDRLAALIDAWFEFEIQLERPPYSVIAAEQSDAVTFGDLEFRVRVDRVDRMEEGPETVVDYKTGQCRRADWDPPRMNQPQLPFYALTYPSEKIDAIAFARIDEVKPAWLRIPDEKDTGGESFAEHCRAWRADLEDLARGIREGDASLDPKLGVQTCRYCEFDLLCRITEARARSDPGGEQDD
ncbi:MAG: PD-(D/E)XK nuclease family protein [Pseudomonadota bacterium]|nr:PD-(D/E)XK nuclease family protein [Pseudomonadota bacterium]